MTLNAIDYKYLGIAIGYSILIYSVTNLTIYFQNDNKEKNKTQSLSNYHGFVFSANCKKSTYGCCPDGYTPGEDASMTNCNCSFSENGCCPDGVTYKLDASGTNCDCKKSTYGCCPGTSSAKIDASGTNCDSSNNHIDTSNPGLMITINILVLFTIVMMWYFEQRRQKTGETTMIPTIMYAGVACILTAFVLYISFMTIDGLMETNINTSTTNDDQTTDTVNYCTDPCSWYNKDQCTKNLTWNGIACIWDATKQTCNAPKPDYWARNILRTITIIVSIVILFLLFIQRNSVQSYIRSDKDLAWLLDIPAFIERCKQDLQITAPTVWLLLGVEIIILILYYFTNFMAYQAYQNDGTVIYHPTIPTSFQTSVGCQVINQLNKHAKKQQKRYGDATKDSSQNIIVIRKGWVSNLYTDGSTNNPIPDNTYTLSTDFITNIGYNTNEIQTLNSTNYNYGISLWFYIDPHQTGSNHNNWYTLFNFDVKPKIQYNPDKNTLRMQVYPQSDSQQLTTDIDLKTSRNIPNVPLQKWNHLFINNIGGTMDLLLNGEVVANIAQIIPRHETKYIYIGQHGGIVGRICNIVYFKTTLNKLQINDIYHKYKNYNPPIL